VRRHSAPKNKSNKNMHSKQTTEPYKQALFFPSIPPTR
jgi:hypothetical protein